MTKFTITDDQIKFIRDELEEVLNKQGPFKVDPQVFAWSVMESNTEHAKNILKLLDEIGVICHDIEGWVKVEEVKKDDRL